MSRINVYLPDDLADAARASDLNVSAITQAAIRSALEANSVTSWLDALTTLEPVEITHEQVERAVDEAREELWGDD
jgi:hypothetical protein